ncbi:hypothetical protein Taro_041215, partial [Colocasia esculenta]|nr:hypothetical protein [Colocasia esculenta]
VELQLDFLSVAARLRELSCGFLSGVGPRLATQDLGGAATEWPWISLSISISGPRWGGDGVAVDLPVYLYFRYSGSLILLRLGLLPLFLHPLDLAPSKTIVCSCCMLRVSFGDSILLFEAKTRGLGKSLRFSRCVEACSKIMPCVSLFKSILLFQAVARGLGKSPWVQPAVGHRLTRKWVKTEEFEDDENPTDVKVEIEALPNAGISSLSFPPAPSLPVHKMEALDENSCLESSNVDNLHSLDVEEDELFTSESENEESGENRDLDSGKRSSLLAMNFATEEVELAIKILGKFNLALRGTCFCFISLLVWSLKESALEAMFGTMDATLRLLAMGFTEREISSAIDNFGKHA